ncbi:EAL domain-containing protein [Candidatus Aalborgicola defluviihabitans]|uniref:EAL domain-containing protein n=1 Tax=Candidatus Aalborgicola defluviihabitans TaxID=3386187 RepID=UPI0039B8364F
MTLPLLAPSLPWRAAWDLSVVAEGVETKEQADLLVAMGCNQVQGNYFAAHARARLHHTAARTAERANMTKLAWRSIGQGELAQLLKEAVLDESRAVGRTTVYRLNVSGREVLAVALPGGGAVVIEPQAPPRIKRRRMEPPAIA